MITKLGVYAWPSPISITTPAPPSTTPEIVDVGGLCIERILNRNLEIETMVSAGNLAIDQAVLADSAIDRTLPRDIAIARVIPNILETL